MATPFTAASDSMDTSGPVGAAGNLAGNIGRLGLAWLELAKAELAVAKLSAVRLLAGVAIAVVLAVSIWLFACLGLGYWIGGLLHRMDAAFALVALVNLLILVGLVVQMRRWWTAMQMSDSRAALGEIARAMS